MGRRIKISPDIFINVNSNLNDCGKCKFKDPYKNNCKYFQKEIKRQYQGNGGYHNTRCKNCFDCEVKFDNLAGNPEKQAERFFNWLGRYEKVKKELEKIEREE